MATTDQDTPKGQSWCDWCDNLVLEQTGHSFMRGERMVFMHDGCYRAFKENDALLDRIFAGLEGMNSDG